MIGSEIKYIVSEFTDVRSELIRLGAKSLSRSASEHYYAQMESNDVTKLVVRKNGSEIHILTENNGMFTLRTHPKSPKTFSAIMQQMPV
jgi:hypothetical protein